MVSGDRPVPAPAVGRGLSPSAPARSTPAPRADAEAPSLGGARGGGTRRDHRRNPPGGTRSRGAASHRRGRLRERDGGSGSRWDREPRRHRAPGVAGPPRAHPQPNGGPPAAARDGRGGADRRVYRPGDRQTRRGPDAARGLRAPHGGADRRGAARDRSRPRGVRPLGSRAGAGKVRGSGADRPPRRPGPDEAGR